MSFPAFSLVTAVQETWRYRRRMMVDPARISGKLDTMATATHWLIYPQADGEPFIAAGISDWTTTAVKAAVDTFLTTPGAARALLLRLPVPGDSLSRADRQRWPPIGEVQVFTRDQAGHHGWRPLHRRNDA